MITFTVATSTLIWVSIGVIITVATSVGLIIKTFNDTISTTIIGKMW